MSKETDKFMKDFKATEKRLKEFASAEAEKRKKTLITNLEKTWAAEDVVQEAVQKARLGGVQGKKTADFVKEGDVAKTLKVWQKELKVHLSGLKEFETYCKEAQGLHQELGKRVAAIEKDMKKSGGTSDVKLMATVKEAKRALPDLQKTAKAFGTLQGHVVLYGANLQRTLDAIVKTALEGVDPKEFPKAFEGDNRKKTAKILKDHTRKIDALCKAGQKAVEAGDEKVEKVIAKANKLLSDLEKIDDEGKKVAKTMKKEIKDAKDGKEVEDLIKVADLTYKKCSAEIEALEDALSDMETVT